MKTLLAAVALVAFGSVATSSGAPVQWSTGLGGNGHFYELVHSESHINWQDAESRAEFAGGYLATPTSEAENDWVYTNIVEANSPGNEPVYDILLGAHHDRGAPPADGWHWVTGEPWAFRAWRDGEPNGDLGGDRGDYLSYASFTVKGWNDTGNTEVQDPHHYFIVEYYNNPRAPFSNVTADFPGLDDIGSGNSVAWIDFDHDGDFDLSVGAGANNTNRLFLNRVTENGVVSFDLLSDPLIANPNTTRGLGWGVFGDSDLCPDLYQGLPFGDNVLLNNTCGTVVNVTNSVTAGSSAQTNGVRVVDFDGDGRLDIHELRPDAPDRLLRNLGNWQFEEVPSSALNIVDGSFDAAWVDVDGDGDQDVYVTRESPWPNVLLRNDGGSVFTEVTPSPLAIADRSQGATWGDYDNDGDLDLFVTNWLTTNRLFRNDGNLNFTDVTVAGMDVARRGQSAVWGDLNNDGWLDLYVANQGDPNQLWLNVPDGAVGRTFEDVTYPTVANLGPSTGVGMADYDQDGDLDIYVGAHLGANTLLRNELPAGNHWLEVDLVATQSNPSAIGARLTLSAGGVTMCREVGANNGMWSQEPTRQHFGLANNAGPVQLTVRWPSGVISQTVVSSVDRIMSVTEPAAAASFNWPVVFADDFEDGPDPSWIQPHEGWVWEAGRMRNTTTDASQQGMPDIWAGGSAYSDYLLSFDVCITSSPGGFGTSLNVYAMSQLACEHADGQTGAYAVDAGYGGSPQTAVGGLNLIQPWPNVVRLQPNVANPAFHFQPGTVYRVIFGRLGSDIVYKKWETSATEPAEWLLRASDNTHHSGYWGISFWQGYGWIDNVQVRSPLFRPLLADVPQDQGGALMVTWGNNVNDSPSAVDAITSYIVQRFAAGWQDVAIVTAAAADTYSVVVTTPDIAVAGVPPSYSRYRVIATTANPAVTYTSLVDSAYSIDNLPPAAPLLTLYDTESSRTLIWQADPIADVGETCLYRDATPEFEAGSPIACSASAPWYNETDLHRYYYRARTYDIHGNASPWSAEVVGRWPTPVPDAMPTALRLYPCQPNPFNPRTTIKYDLPEAGLVRLSVFDLAGRLVRTLVDESKAQGSFEAVWDGRNGSGREVGSGTYLARLDFAGVSQVVRMGLVR